MTISLKPNGRGNNLKIFDRSQMCVQLIDAEQFSFEELVSIHEKLIKGLLNDYRIACETNHPKQERLAELLDHLLNGPLAKENQALAKKLLAKQGILT